jgi:hypothetical protein
MRPRLRALLLLACTLGVAGGGPPLSLPLQRRRHPGGALHPARRALLTVEESAQLPLDANAWGQGHAPARARCGCTCAHVRLRAARAAQRAARCALRQLKHPLVASDASRVCVRRTARAQRVHHHHHARHAAAAVQRGCRHRLRAAVGRLWRLRHRLRRAFPRLTPCARVRLRCDATRAR